MGVGEVERGSGKARDGRIVKIALQICIGMHGKLPKKQKKKILSSNPGERALRASRENSHAIALNRFLNMELPGSLSDSSNLSDSTAKSSTQAP